MFDSNRALQSNKIASVSFFLLILLLFFFSFSFDCLKQVTNASDLQWFASLLLQVRNVKFIVDVSILLNSSLHGCRLYKIR